MRIVILYSLVTLRGCEVKKQLFHCRNLDTCQPSRSRDPAPPLVRSGSSLLSSMLSSVLWALRASGMTAARLSTRL
jgi:hypothetical protein